MIKVIRKALLVLVSSFLPIIAGANPSQQDAQNIVEKAAAFATANGKDKLITEVNKKDGTFHKGELYVFVYDIAGTLIAHPIEKNKLGQNNISKPDADGKLFRKEIVEVAKNKGSGWVEYKSENPVSGKVEPKASFVKKQGDIIIVAGIYVK